MSSRYDIVLYGATGFTGTYVLRTLATLPLFENKTVAVAGRNEGKLRETLNTIAKETGNLKVLEFPIIVADSSDNESLAAMAKQAKVIINTVGPYILYGEPIVRAAIENGANHVDISGEPAFLLGMEKKYNQAAKEAGVYIVGACGFDTIPCDLGAEFLKQNFDGTLAYVDTCTRMNPGPAGYALNTGTYESILWGARSHVDGSETALKNYIMPKHISLPKHKPPFRFPLTIIQEDALTAWALPFPGFDKTAVQRSQYFDFYVNGQTPYRIRTYATFGSLFNMLLIAVWAGVIGFFALFGPTRRFLSAHPETCSFGMFKKNGPTAEQIKGTTFDYFFFGTGWAKGKTPDEDVPTKKATVVCHGPDPAYVGTSACICSAALALLNDTEKLPKDGGVMTTATAFRNTRIYEYLRTMGVTFDLIDKEKRE